MVKQASNGSIKVFVATGISPAALLVPDSLITCDDQHVTNPSESGQDVGVCEDESGIGRIFSADWGKWVGIGAAALVAVGAGLGVVAFIQVNKGKE